MRDLRGIMRDLCGTFQIRLRRNFWQAGRQSRGESGTFAGFALKRECAAHHFAEAAGDDEAEACAAVFLVDAGFGLGEGLEQTADLLGAHADAGVANFKGEGRNAGTA